jgi:hypothetical protein
MPTNAPIPHSRNTTIIRAAFPQAIPKTDATAKQGISIKTCATTGHFVSAICSPRQDETIPRIAESLEKVTRAFLGRPPVKQSGRSDVRGMPP